MTTPLRFESVEVLSLEGFGRAGLRLDDLSEGVNVVIGPNASGKTRTTSVIQWLLWPTIAPKHRIALAGKFHLGGHAWLLDLDHGDERYRRDGLAHDPPTLPPSAVAERYTLGLHEMLASDSQPLAGTIIRESAGGYDPDDASRALGFRPSATRPKKEPAAVMDCRKEHGSARDSQEAIQNDEALVDSLYGELEGAERAASRVQVLLLAADRAIQQETARQSQARLEVYPPALARVAGDEVERLKELASKLTQVCERRALAEDTRLVAEEVRQRCNLQGEGLPTDLVGTLRGELDTLRDAVGAVRTRREELVRIRATMASCRERLGDAVTDDQLGAIDSNRIVDLSEFAARYENAWATQLALAAQAERLQDEDDGPVDADALKQAQGLLLQWLRAGQQSRTGPGWVTRIVLMCTALVIVGLAVALGWAATWPLALLILLAIPPLVVAVLPASIRGGGRSSFERAYRDLSVAPPQRWRVADVSRLVEELHRQIGTATVVHERLQRLASVEKDLRAAQVRIDELERQRTELAQRFGVALDAAVARDGRTLAWLIRQLQEWQAAADGAASAAAGLEGAKNQRRSLLARIDKRLAEHGYPGSTSIDEAKSRVEDLAGRGNDHDRATTRIEAEAQSIARLQQEQAGIEADIESVYIAIDLDPGDMEALTRLCKDHAGYVAASKGRDEAALRVRDAEERLRGHSLFDDDLLSTPADDIEVQRSRAETEAARIIEIRDHITRIGTRVDQAKKTHDVAKALAALRAAEDALGERREQDHRAVAGHVVASWLADETRDSTRPPVFRRAGDLFTKITRHRYRLDIADGSSPSFRAYDVNQERMFELDELSSGTRIQLLLAVRMAFVELSEEGVKLPLILDETLAISDDDRAMAIVEAVLQLCEDGRQVFYFTAQQDEVNKWARALKRREVPRRFLDLAAGRALADVEVFGEIVAEEEPEQVPPPGDMTYEEYGRLLEVPAIDLYRPLGEVHVWHLLEDAQLLRRLLELGIERKGQLEFLLGRSGGRLAGMGEMEEQATRTAMRSLMEIQKLWNIGRGKRVDRGALVETKAVGSSFLDAVERIARERDGDGKRFAEALTLAVIKGFGPKKVAVCRERLEEAGYIDAEERLSADRIRIGVLGEMGSDVMSGEFSGHVIERMLRNVLG
jgi:hypothetical protein